jgi:host cell factor
MSSLTTSTSTHPEEESLEEKRTSVSSGRASRAEITWSNPPLDGIVPSARGGHSAILANTQLIIFGGHYFGGHGKFVYLNDIHRLDLETSTWHEVRAGGEPPAPRYGHSAVLVGGTKMFIFGGKGDNGQVFRDMYYLDLTDSTWYIVNWTTDAPSGRFGHACVALDTQIVIQGGWDGKKSMEDFWVFDTDNFNWIKPKTSGNSPGPRHNHVMAFTKDGRIIVYGGYIVTSDTLPQYNKDTYFLDSESMKWTRPRVTGDYPIGTFGHTIALHEDIAFVLGGWSGTERHPIFMGDKKVKENAKILAREEVSLSLYLFNQLLLL